MDIPQIITIVIFFLFVILFTVWKIYKNGLRKTVVDLIVKAEETLEDNQEKFDSVVMGVITKLPFPFNILITTKSINKFVQTTFDEIKKALDYQKKSK